MKAARKTLLTVGDQKGLLAACHTQDIANTYGRRFWAESPVEEKADLAPDVLWRLLALYIGRLKTPLILDIEAGPEVWNYPVFAYQIKYNSTGEGKQIQGAMTLLMADNSVHVDFVGLKVRRHVYFFQCEREQGAVVVGSGKWIGASRENHPDFAWYPYQARAENPEVDYPTVKHLLASSEKERDPATPDPERTETERTETDRPATDFALIDKPNAPVVLSPLELAAAVAATTSDFAFDITVDRLDGGRYKIGETFQVTGVSEVEGYLYLFHINPAGRLNLLFPSDGAPRKISADKRFEIPAPKDKTVFRVTGPPWRQSRKGDCGFPPTIFDRIGKKTRGWKTNLSLESYATNATANFSQKS